MDGKNNHIYKLRYKIESEAGKFKAEDANDSGLTDALLIVSMIEAEDGSYSQDWFSHDGNTNDNITHQQLFKVWSMLGMQLARDKKLGGWHRALVESFAEALTDVIENIKDGSN